MATVTWAARAGLLRELRRCCSKKDSLKDVFPKLSSGNSIPKAELSWIAHFCEVAWKTGGQAVTGVEAFNTSLGYKTLPRPPPPS